MREYKVMENYLQLFSKKKKEKYIPILENFFFIIGLKIYTYFAYKGYFLLKFI